MKSIHLWGVKQNNLKNLNVEIPLGTFTVLCGPSGSGKSSLAFETLYAEGQRRYIESLSTYVRQFLAKAPKPDIEGIENIPPAIAIEQKNSVKTNRSTVATTTELSEYLRLLYEKLGVAFCPEHKTAVRKESVSEATQIVLEKFSGERGYILAPITSEGRVAKGKKLQALLLKEGITRIVLPNERVPKVLELNEILTEKKALPTSDFLIVVDRLSFDRENEGRIADSIAQAYRLSLHLNTAFQGGHTTIMTSEGRALPFSEELACSQCGFSFPPLESRLFSFNNPVGACGTCNGFGNILTIDPQKVVPNERLSIAAGAIHPFTMPSAGRDRRALLNFCRRSQIDVHRPWEELSKEDKEQIWQGDSSFIGINGLFEFLESKKYKMHVRVFLSRYKSGFRCPDCHGSRLKPITNHILIQGHSLSQLLAMTIGELSEFMRNLPLTPMAENLCAEILRQIRARLEFLVNVGVEYLTLDRPTRTLSGGEYQRLMLAQQLGASLSHTLYVLDEPTVGLHPRDSHRLISILKQIKELGNTLVVVEHDRDVIESADYVMELGPGSGELGGEIIFSGPRADFFNCASSATVPFLTSQKSYLPQRNLRPVDMSCCRYKIELRGCSGNNLKNVDLVIPLNRFVVITGVSGSGKTTLITQTLYPALSRHLGTDFERGQTYSELAGADQIKNVLLIDQSPIGGSARSNLATFLKIFDGIRNVMAATSEAKLRGYTPGTFSLNIDGGRCPVCKGMGVEIVDMIFMDDVTIVCDACDGSRFRPEILEISYRGKNISQILDLTVEEALRFFVAYPGIRHPLVLLQEMGMEYLRLGQSSKSLSGGESQRLKIAREFLTREQKQTFYIMDEPTTGLHFREISLLLTMLNRLIDGGGHVVVIEHNLDVIKSADYVIDLGPEAGSRGGYIVAEGTPEEISRFPKSLTGAFLKPFFHTQILRGIEH